MSQTLHKKFMDRKAQWFEALDHIHFVMWWVPVGHQPTLEKALAKLKHLQDYGETEAAFGRAYMKDRA